MQQQLQQQQHTDPTTAAAAPSTVDTSAVDAAWREEFQPALRAVAAVQHGDLDAWRALKLRPRNKMNWALTVTKLVRPHRRFIDALADHILAEFDDYVQRRLVAPLHAILQQDRGEATCPGFSSATDRPVDPATVSAAARDAVVEYLGAEMPPLQGWLTWVRVAFQYVHTTIPKYAGRCGFDCALWSRVGERVYDGLHLVLRAALGSFAQLRREARALSAEGAEVQRATKAIDTIVRLATMTSVRRPDTQRRRGLEAELLAYANDAAQPWLLSIHGSTAAAATVLTVPTVLEHHIGRPYVAAAIEAFAAWVRGAVASAGDAEAHEAGVPPLRALLAKITRALTTERADVEDLFRTATAAARAMDTLAPAVASAGGGATNAATASPRAAADEWPYQDGTSAAIAAIAERALAAFDATVAETALYPLAEPILAVAAVGGSRDRPGASAVAALGPVVTNADSFEAVARLIGGAPGIADSASAMLPRAIAAEVRRCTLAIGTDARAAAEAHLRREAGEGTDGVPAAAPSGTAVSTARRVEIARLVEGVTDAWASLHAAVTSGAESRKLTEVLAALRKAFAAYVCDGTAPTAGSTDAQPPHAVLGPQLTVAMALPRYLDLSLKGAAETRAGAAAAGEEQLLVELRGAAALMPLVREQDALAHTYRLLLAERLLAGRSVDLEGQAIGVLRKGCPLLRDAELLLRDFVAATSDDGGERRAVNAGGAIATLPFEFNVTAVAQGRWPAFANVTFTPPAGVAEAMRRTEAAWRGKQRQLVWQVQAGRAAAVIRFKAGAKEVGGGLVAVAALAHIGADTVTIEQLLHRLGFLTTPATTASSGDADASATKHQHQFPALLKQALLSLGTVPRMLLVDGAPVTSPASIGATLSANGANVARHTVAINPEFRSKTRKHELRAVAVSASATAGKDPTAAAEAKELDDRRRMAVEATVTRVMKSRKVLPTRELIEETQRVLAPVFGCPARAVREAITRLIEREYLERAPEGSGDGGLDAVPTVRYLA